MIRTDNNFEIQYKKERKINYLIIIMISAFLLELIEIAMQISSANIGMLDMFVNNTTGNILVINIITWLIPIAVGFLGLNQFNYYNNIKDKIFVRFNQRKFIFQRTIKSITTAMMYTAIFYIFCFIFLFIIVKTAIPNIYNGVSFADFNSSAMYFYFFNPIIYLLFYIFVSVLFSGVFASLGFLLSLYFKNNAIVALGPFSLALTYSLIMEHIPYGLLFSYNNISILTPSIYPNLPDSIHILTNIITPVSLLTMSLIAIWLKSKKDAVL